MGSISTEPRVNAHSTSPNSSAQISPNGSHAQGSVVAIFYLDGPPVRVQGLTSGRTYEFSSADRIREVDARDAPALLCTRFFQRA